MSRRFALLALLGSRPMTGYDLSKQFSRSVAQCGTLPTVFREWMNEPLEIGRQRDPASVKAAHLDWAEADAAHSQLRQHHAYWSGHLERTPSADLGPTRSIFNPATDRVAQCHECYLSILADLDHSRTDFPLTLC